MAAQAVCGALSVRSTADTRQAAPTRFELFQQGVAGNNAAQPKNPMQQAATPGTTTTPATPSPLERRENKPNPDGQQARPTSTNGGR